MSEGVLQRNLPPLVEVEWQHVADANVVLVGAGAVGRPLARGLAQFGLRRMTVCDPKRYRERSILSQCRPEEVGRLKAEVVVEELNGLGAEAIAMPRDVEQVPPGYFENALVVVAVDNRRAEILANRQALRMRCKLMKVNIEPLYLTASLRYYDFSRSPVDVCLECQMSDAHYADQHHPLSCDGDETPTSRPTASPRPLCELAANAAALVIAQILGSPGHWTEVWRNRQWQANLLGGQTQISQLTPKANCRCDHTACWPNLTRRPAPLDKLTLAELILAAGFAEERTQLHFSSPLTTRQRCSACGVEKRDLRWLTSLDDDLAPCPCGSPLRAVPFYSSDQFAATDLAPWLDVPLASLGAPAQSLISLTDGSRPASYLLGPGRD